MIKRRLEPCGSMLNHAHTVNLSPNILFEFIVVSQTFHCKTTLHFFPLLRNCFLSFSSIEKKIARDENYNVSRIGYLRNPSRTVTVFDTFRILNFSGMDFFSGQINFQGSVTP